LIQYPSYLVFFNEVHKGGPLHFNRLPIAVKEREHEVEEVGLAEIARGLLLKVGAA
jgi:hypothetical protein